MTRTTLEEKIRYHLYYHNRNGDMRETYELKKKDPEAIVLPKYYVEKTVDEICDFIIENKSKIITSDEVITALMYRVDDLKKDIEEIRNVIYKK